MSYTLRREPVTTESRNLVSLDSPDFKDGKRNWKTIRQQGIANCPLPASVAALAKVWPEQVKLMLSPSLELVHSPFRSWFDDRPQPTSESEYFQGERLIGVRFYDGWLVKVTPLLYYRPGNKNTWFARSTDGGGWISYIEKAYAVWRGRHRYEKMEDLFVDQIVYDLWGRFDKIALSGDKPDVFLDSDPEGARANDDYSKDYLKSFLSRAEDDRPTVATTHEDEGISLIPAHTYVVVERKGNHVVLWEAMHDSTETVEIADFWDEFDGVYQARRKPYKS